MATHIQQAQNIFYNHARFSFGFGEDAARSAHGAMVTTQEKSGSSPRNYVYILIIFNSKYT